MSAPADRPNRQRLDQLLVERGLAETRSRAQALILSGHVRVGEGAAARTDRKSGDLVENTIALEVEAPPPFVSRGGLKLRAASRRLRRGAGRIGVLGRRVVYGRFHGSAAAA